MQAYWTDKKPDGSAITDGRLCRVVDPEDGSIPIRVYGKTAEEVYGKIERTMMTAQSTLTETRRPDGNGNGNGRKTVVFGPLSDDPPRNPAILNADETMQLTADLQNPAKSAQASYRLAESERARHTDAQKNYLQICREFPSRHPDFFNHKTNRTLLINKALLTVGEDISKITPEVLDRCYRHLQEVDALLAESDVILELPNDNNRTPAVPPGGSLEPVPARPTSGVVSSTSHRSSRLGAPTAPKWQPKFSQAEINKLTLKESEALSRTTHPRHKEYLEACDYWYGGAQATA